MATSKRTALFAGLAALVLLAVIVYGMVLMSDRMSIKDTQAPFKRVATEQLQFEIADTQTKQAFGLGGRSSIPDNYGMLFVFTTSERYGFWMKDMLVPIDIIWLSDNGTILLVDHSVDPSTYPHVLYPPSPVRYVLETRAGYARDHAWDVGTKVQLPSPYGL